MKRERGERERGRERRKNVGRGREEGEKMIRGRRAAKKGGMLHSLHRAAHLTNDSKYLRVAR